jgi:hypothetical protein
LKILLFASVGIIVLSSVAYSKGDEKNASTTSLMEKSSGAEKLGNMPFHGTEKKPFHGDKTSVSAVPSSPVLESLKNNHLEVSSTKTIGQAFDSYKYAVKKEWRETPPTKNNSTYYIDYICWTQVRPFSFLTLMKGVKERGLEIKFAIRADGETSIALARRLDIKRDGKLHATPLLPPEIKKAVTAIYENREITF